MNGAMLFAKQELLYLLGRQTVQHFFAEPVGGPDEDRSGFGVAGRLIGLVQAKCDLVPCVGGLEDVVDFPAGSWVPA